MYESATRGSNGFMHVRFPIRVRLSREWFQSEFRTIQYCTGMSTCDWRIDAVSRCALLILILPCSSAHILHTDRPLGSRARRLDRRRKVAADGWQVARVWSEAGALRAHGGALAHAGRCSRLDESKIELAREGRQI